MNIPDFSLLAPESIQFDLSTYLGVSKDDLYFGRVFDCHISSVHISDSAKLSSLMSGTVETIEIVAKNSDINNEFSESISILLDDEAGTSISASF